MVQSVKVKTLKSNPVVTEMGIGMGLGNNFVAGVGTFGVNQLLDFLDADQVISATAKGDIIGFGVPNAIVIVHCKNAIPPDVLKQLGAKFEVGNHTFYGNLSQAASNAKPTSLDGSAASLRRVLERSQEPKLSAHFKTSLRDSDFRSPFVMVIDIADLPQLIGLGVAAGKPLSKDFDGVASVGIELRFEGKEASGTQRWACKDNASANRLKDTFEEKQKGPKRRESGC